MTLTRRAFLLVTGLCWLDAPAFALPSGRVFVLDEALRAQAALRLPARITPLIGDAGWLWHEHLSRERKIAGLTRPADAFILAQLAMPAGLRATHRALNAEAVLWTLE